MLVEYEIEYILIFTQQNKDIEAWTLPKAKKII